MNPSAIFEAFDLDKKTELDKVFYLAIASQLDNPSSEFHITDVYQWFDEIGLSRPNQSRLVSRIKKDKRFIKGASANGFKVSATAIKASKQLFKDFQIVEEPKVKDQSILPIAVYSGTRKYIETICNQINVAFEHAVFDGCSVMMRRLIEVLLISCYVNEGSEAEITDSDGNRFPLSKIINYTLSNSKFGLGKTCKDFLHSFRTLGNLSAHEIYYTCKRAELTAVATEFRVSVEELLFKSGLK